MSASLIDRVKAHPRRFVAAAVLAVLLVAAVTDLPSRLGQNLPEAPKPPSGSAGPPGVLSGLTTDENYNLDRCTRTSARNGSGCGRAPKFRAGEWLNTGGKSLRATDLRGSVVLVDFFSGSCINCVRDSRYLRAWDRTYRANGLRVVGVLSPEFAFEKKPGYGASAVRSLGLTFPVLLDDTLATTTAYRSQFLPSKYLIDVGGTVRSIWSGESGYVRIEQQIRALLEGAGELPPPVGVIDDGNAAGPGTTSQIYLGDSRSTSYDGEPRTSAGKRLDYFLAPGQAEGTYSLGGPWTVGTQLAVPGEGAKSRVAFRVRRVFQLIGGTGSITVSAPGQPDRLIGIKGQPSLRQIYEVPKASSETVTVTYSGDLEVYAFSFG